MTVVVKKLIKFSNLASLSEIKSLSAKPAILNEVRLLPPFAAYSYCMLAFCWKTYSLDDVFVLLYLDQADFSTGLKLTRTSISIPAGCGRLLLPVYRLSCPSVDCLLLSAFLSNSVVV